MFFCSNNYIVTLLFSRTSDCGLGYADPIAQDDELAEKLWQVSEKMVGLTQQNWDTPQLILIYSK